MMFKALKVWVFGVEAPDFHKLDSIQAIVAIHLLKVGAPLVPISDNNYDLEDFTFHNNLSCYLGCC